MTLYSERLLKLQTKFEAFEHHHWETKRSMIEEKDKNSLLMAELGCIKEELANYKVGEYEC